MENPTKKNPTKKQVEQFEVKVVQVTKDRTPFISLRLDPNKYKDGDTVIVTINHQLPG